MLQFIFAHWLDAAAVVPVEGIIARALVVASGSPAGRAQSWAGTAEGAAGCWVSGGNVGFCGILDTFTLASFLRQPLRRCGSP